MERGAASTSIIEWISATCARYPDDVAVSGDGEHLTFQELWTKSMCLANSLIERGVAVEDFVGLCAEQSSDLLVGIVGILAAGAVYVPLDPLYPKARLDYIVSDAGLSFIVASDHLHAIASDLGTPISIRSNERSLPPTQRWAHISGENAAYLIYTSGSTGIPKGVLIEQHSVIDVFSWLIEEFHVERGDRFVVTSSPSFDASIPGLLLPLVTGGTFVALPNASRKDPFLLADHLARHRPRFVQIMPTMLEMLTEMKWSGDMDLTFWAGGEPTPAPVIEYIASRSRDLVNFYGPTESTFAVSAAHLEPTDVDSPVGFAALHAACVLLDANGEKTSPGNVGEIFITGTQLARGYLNDPALTADRFVDLDLGEGRKTRAYRTGDLARVRSDGSLVVLGRADDQVKIRGYRIELGEIETTLSKSPHVLGVHVIADETSNSSDQRLVAFVKYKDGASSDELRKFAKASLPEYMVPSIFVEVEDFPIGDTGKIDKKKLQAFLSSEVGDVAPMAPAPTGVQPSSSIEASIRTMFAIVLEVEEDAVGLDQDFFDLGGTSLRCMRLFMAIEERYGVALPLSTLVANPTVQLLSSVVARESGDDVRRLTVFKSLGDWEWALGILWSEILGNREVGPSDNFFELGGNEAEALLMLDQLREIYGTGATLAELKQAPTVVEFAMLTVGRASRSSLVPLNANGTKVPFFCIAGPGGLALTFLPLARLLGPDQPFYGLQSHGVERRGLPDFTLNMAASRYVRAIREVQPHGPYLIGGHSFGGAYALKVAHRLAADGENVALLAIFESVISDRLSGLSDSTSRDDAQTSDEERKHYKLSTKLSMLVRLPFTGLIRQPGIKQYELFALHATIQSRFAKRLMPWSGRAVVYVSEGARAEKVRNTWRHLLTGRKTFATVTGGHTGLLQRPHVTQLAPHLMNEIQNALSEFAHATIETEIPIISDEH